MVNKTVDVITLAELNLAFDDLYNPPRLLGRLLGRLRGSLLGLPSGPQLSNAPTG